MAAPLRFSLSALIGAMLLVSVYLAALRQSSAWAAAAALTLTIGVLVFGLLWAVFRPSANRHFWIGFQLCGWAYLMIAFSDWSQAQLANYLLSTRVVASLHSQMPIAPSQTAMVEWHGTWYPAEVLRTDGSRSFIHYTGYGSNWDEWVGPSRIRGQLGPFLQVCHALVSLIAGLTGGVFSAWVSNVAGPRRMFWILWCCAAGAVVAAGVLGMLFNSELAASIAFSLLLVELALAVIAGWHSSAGDSDFARGVALIGWGYFLLHFGPGLEAAVGSKLLTTYWLNQAYHSLHPGSLTFPTGMVTFAVSGSATYTQLSSYPSFSSGMAQWYAQPIGPCVLGGHSALAVLLSLTGGIIALWLTRTGVHPISEEK